MSRALAFAAACALRNAVAAQPPTAPTIATPCGSVSGAVDAIPLTGEAVFRYSAIPYAAPPLGQLRFMPPTPYECPWPGVLNGSAAQPACVQTNGSGDEDCLTLSVYVPPNASAAPGPLPVLVYFHGGNLIGGSAPVSELEVLAVRAPGTMITVGVNYRLNTLGFLATADLAAEPGWVGNAGIADAIAALRWVRDSIAAFHGDASRVTLMGQSSGGTLIFALFAAPSAAGLFAGAISLSGSPNISQSAAAKQAQDAPVTAAVNCAGPPTPAARVACLRALPAAELALATPKPSWDTPGIFGWSLPAGVPPPPAGPSYAGIVHVDGVLLTRPFHEALAAQLVPAALIISNMEAEGDGGGGIGMRNATAATWLAALNGSFAGWPPAEGAAAAAALAAAYASEAAADAELAYDSISADYGLSCAARALADAVAATGVLRAAPLYVMYNAWPPAAPNAHGNGVWPYHGLDLQAMGWGWGAPPGASDLEEATLLQGLVAEFAASRGVVQRWGWQPVAPGQPLRTLVVAQGVRFPGGGTRAEVGWKADACGVLGGIGIDRMEYWWCD